MTTFGPTTPTTVRRKNRQIWSTTIIIIITIIILITIIIIIVIIAITPQTAKVAPQSGINLAKFGRKRQNSEEDDQVRH